MKKSTRLAPLEEVIPAEEQIERFEHEVAAEADQVYRRAPEEPTLQERRDHELLHEPYRAWCPYCVAGRGAALGHFAKDHAEDAFAVVGIDYGYLGDREDASPIIFGKDRKHRWVFAFLVPSKGVGHPYSAKALVDVLLQAGHKRFTFR